jgi:hypothetical protein
MRDELSTQQIDKLERLLWEQMEAAPEDDVERAEWRLRRENLGVHCSSVTSSPRSVPCGCRGWRYTDDKCYGIPGPTSPTPIRGQRWSFRREYGSLVATSPPGLNA